MIFAHGSGGGGQAVPIGAEVCIYFAGGLKRFISSLQDSLYSTTTCYYYTVITGLVCLIHTICHTPEPEENEFRFKFLIVQKIALNKSFAYIFIFSRIL